MTDQQDHQRAPSPQPAVDFTPPGQPADQGPAQDPDLGQYEQRTAIILLVIGIIYLPFFFGPLGIYHARRASRLGVESRGVVIAGWIETALGVIILAAGAVFFLFVRGRFL